jgi:uncharacterized protein YgbK (DUF1537 family)
MATPYRVCSSAANRTSAATANSAAAVGSKIIVVLPALPLATRPVHESECYRDGEQNENPEKKAPKFIHYRFHACLQSNRGFGKGRRVPP